jgi:hypothetical protein
MRRPARALLVIALAAALQAALSFQEGHVWLLDTSGNPLPPEVEGSVYFRVGNATYTASKFKELLGNASAKIPNNFTVFYSFSGLNWSVKYERPSNTTLILHLRRIGNVFFRFIALDTSYARRSETLSLLDVTSGMGVPGLYVFAQSANLTKPVLRPDSCKPDTYLPVANGSGAPYLWRIIAVYGNDIVLNESLKRIWEAGALAPVDLNLVKIPRELNLSWIAGECPGARVLVNVACGEQMLTNEPPSTVVKAGGEWFYPTGKNCSVRVAFAGVEKVCNTSILELERCKPEIYPVEVRVTGFEGGAGLVEVSIDGSPLDLQNPTTCVWRGDHVLRLRYNFSGKWMTLAEKAFRVEARSLVPVRVNFSRIELSVHGCTQAPQLLVEGIEVPITKLERATGPVYVSAPLPVMEAKMTLKACNATLAFRARIENLTLAISLPEVNLEFEKLNPTPLVALLVLALAQTALVVYALAAVRRWSRCSTPAR